MMMPNEWQNRTLIIMMVMISADKGLKNHNNLLNLRSAVLVLNLLMPNEWDVQ